MRKFLVPPILLMAIASLAFGQTPGAETKSRVNPLVGNWKANLSKSQRDPNHQFQSLALRIEVSSDDGALLLTFTGINMSGKEVSVIRKLQPDGKERPVAEANGIVEVSRWVGPQTLESVARKDGAVIGEGRYEVSSDGKTLTSKVKGTDAKGRLFEQLIVFDRD
jgi:hypothetical protein